MDQERLARLTDQQRTCLRFVYEGMSSKAIAQRLGIEPGSVDQHLKAAMRILGVSGRHTAARLLVEAEQGGGQPAVQFRDMPSTEGTMRSQPVRGEAPRPLARDLVHEDQLRFERSRPPGNPALPLPLWGWKPHHLSWAQRLGLVVAAAVGIALTFAALVAALEAIVRLVSR